MAKADVIANQLVELETATENVQRLLRVFMDGSGDVPDWVLVVHDGIQPVVRALESLGKGVRQEVLPHLRDIDRVGGMGAVAPMVTKVAASQSIPSRA